MTIRVATRQGIKSTRIALNVAGSWTSTMMLKLAVKYWLTMVNLVFVFSLKSATREFIKKLEMTASLLSKKV